MSCTRHYVAITESLGGQTSKGDLKDFYWIDEITRGGTIYQTSSPKKGDHASINRAIYLYLGDTSQH